MPWSHWTLMVCWADDREGFCDAQTKNICSSSQVAQHWAQLKTMRGFQQTSLESRLLLWTAWEQGDHSAVTQLLTVSWHTAPSQLTSNAFVLAMVVFSNCFPISLFSSSFSPSHFLLCIYCHSFLLSLPWQCFQQVPFSSSVPASAPQTQLNLA